MNVRIFKRFIKKDTMVGEQTQDEPVYMWSCMCDDKSCEYCKNLDGKVFTEKSASSLEKQPGEAHEGCRCIWVKVSGSDKPKPIV